MTGHQGQQNSNQDPEEEFTVHNTRDDNMIKWPSHKMSNIKQYVMTVPRKLKKAGDLGEIEENQEDSDQTSTSSSVGSDCFDMKVQIITGSKPSVALINRGVQTGECHEIEQDGHTRNDQPVRARRQQTTCGDKKKMIQKHGGAGDLNGLRGEKANALLHHCCKTGNVDGVEYVVDKFPELIEEGDKRQQTAISVAIKSGNADVLSELLNHCTIEQLTSPSEGHRPLVHAAARYGQDRCLKKTLDVLNSRHLPVDVVDIHGRTACHVAAKYGHLVCIQTLLEHGCDLFLTDKNGYTADYYARYYGQRHIVGYFHLLHVCLELITGADLNSNQEKQELNKRSTIDQVCIKQRKQILDAIKKFSPSKLAVKKWEPNLTDVSHDNNIQSTHVDTLEKKSFVGMEKSPQQTNSPQLYREIKSKQGICPQTSKRTGQSLRDFKKLPTNVLSQRRLRFDISQAFFDPNFSTSYFGVARSSELGSDYGQLKDTSGPTGGTRGVSDNVNCSPEEYPLDLRITIPETVESSENESRSSDDQLPKEHGNPDKERYGPRRAATSTCPKKSSGSTSHSQSSQLPPNTFLNCMQGQLLHVDILRRKESLERRRIAPTHTELSDDNFRECYQSGVSYQTEGEPDTTDLMSGATNPNPPNVSQLKQVESDVFDEVSGCPVASFNEVSEKNSKCSDESVSDAMSKLTTSEVVFGIFV